MNTNYNASGLAETFQMLRQRCKLARAQAGIKPGAKSVEGATAMTIWMDNWGRKSCSSRKERRLNEWLLGNLNPFQSFPLPLTTSASAAPDAR